MTARLLRRFLDDAGGAAALELAGVGAVLVMGAMNTAEVGRYAYEAAAVGAAAQAGAEAAIVACDVDHTPATQNCGALTSAVNTAVQSSRLGSNVTLDGALSEAYYCLTTTGGLAQAGGVNSKPSDCSGVANAAANATPTLYLKVPVTYAYQPLFTGLTVAQTFSAAIKRTAWMRMA